MEHIAVKDLQVTYSNGGSKKALSGVTFSVTAGCIFGLLGPNGAGKTTLIKTILGLIPEYEGEVSVLGKPPFDLKAKKRIGYMPELANYYWYLTPRELLMMYARLCFMDKAAAGQKIEELLDLVDLKSSGNKLMRTFSKGMMQKVSFIQAILNDPDLLILDEPYGGLDPLSRISMKEFISGLRDQGKTIFFSSHELSEVETICDEVAIVHRGLLRKKGRLKELLAEKEETASLEKYFLEVIKKGTD